MAEDNTDTAVVYHCDICREITEGCKQDMLNPEKCNVCDGKGYIDLGSGLALVCSACQRGFRLKLWLRHEEKERPNHPLPEFLLELPSL